MKTRDSCTWSILIPLLIIFLIVISGCIHKPPEKNLTEIHISTVPITNSALLWVAENRSLFQKYGLNVTLTIEKSGIAAVDKMTSGQADIATATEFRPVEMMYRSIPIENLVIIGSLSADEYNFLAARKDRGITSPGDLAGKRIGAMKDTAAEFYLDQYLRLHNLSEKVTVVSLDSDPLFTAFMDGNLDATVIWDLPLMKAEQKFGDNLTIMPVQENMLAYWLLITRKDWYNEHKSTVESLFRALNDAELVIGEEPDLVPEIMNNKFAYNLSFLIKREQYHHNILSLDQSLINTIEIEGRWLKQKNNDNQTYNISVLDLMNADALRQVKPEGVTMY